MKGKYLLKELGTFAFCLSGAFLIAALVMSIFPAKQASAASGAIWTTTNACGAPGQDINHFSVGEHVYINGSDFDPNTSYAWKITGKPGGASSDPGIIVASGNQITDADGAFCFDAYTVAADDDGEYAVDFGGKGDNYGVDGSVLVPTDTSTPTITPTGTLTNTSTNTPTNTPTDTSTNTPSNTPTSITTNTPTNTPSGTFVPPISTNTPTNTPTGTFVPPPSTTVPFSPTSTDTPIPPTSTSTAVPLTATNTPDPGTPTPIPVPATPSGSDGSNVVFPVTGVDRGAFSRGLPIAFVNLCLGFLGLGLILHGVARRFE